MRTAVAEPITAPATSGIAPLDALYLTPASCRLPLDTFSARLYAEHVPLPCIKFDEQPVYKIIT